MADRKKLIELLKHEDCESLGIDGCDSCPYRYKIDCSCVALADHLIASGVTLRKTGRWIDNCCYNTCSVCQKSVHVWNDDGDMQNFDFCPNCGARMEAEHD